ncbi:uncharacterized protein LOC131949357 [Physella acuta]|uniref:uncharacterized protein LOC131949357 n=1 Tax=Physella acuta TaxID=109671 RepID=UPI0027DCED8A|nr:uncharacterized protein LOC131949357 [Physella acuta]
MSFHIILFRCVSIVVLLISCVMGFFTQLPQETACGELKYAGEGVIESPLFPNPYPADIDCTWTIIGPPGSRIQLTSEIFSIEHQPQCMWDFLDITDGLDGEYGRARYCGEEELEFTSISNTVHLHFYSDASGVDPGFKIAYVALTTEQLTGCNVTLNKEGPVVSPGYPTPYPENSLCFYTIQAEVNSHIILEFYDFKVETAPCDYDRLEVYSGLTTTNENLLAVFCGSDPPVSLHHDSNVLTLKFVSDGNVQTRGFNASIQFVSLTTSAPSTTSTTTQEITKSTTVPTTTPQTTSTTTQTTPTTTQPTIPPTTIPTTTVQTTTSSTELPATEISTPRNIGACNSTITSGLANISSPGYPLKYPNSLFCVTKLRSLNHSSFLIKFLNFSVEEAENCGYDSLSIYEANSKEKDLQYSLLKPLQQFCGTSLHDPIFSWEGQGLDVVFRTDLTDNSWGYLAEVLIAPVINGPKCPAKCENGGNCTEVLAVDGSIDWICMCPEKFTGTLCEIKMRPTCDDIVCENGGVCRDDGTKVSCACPNGFSGKFCNDMEELIEGGALYFTKMVSNMSLSIGSSAILECAVNDPAAHVMWLFHDRIITPDDSSLGVEVHPGGVVVIPEVKYENSGRYTCMATTSTYSDLVESSMWLTLIEPCNLYVLIAPNNITIKEGQNALFQCYVPDADVTMWRKDGNLIDKGRKRIRLLVNNYLVISSAVETDSGQYTCVARSKEGCFSKVSAYLHVEGTGQSRECGRPRIKPYEGGLGRISSGKEAAFGSAPWHVILREDKGHITFCGGSLISTDIVLTAAHCITQFEMMFGYPFHPRHIQVYLGTTHCAGNGGSFRQIKTYTLHENFNDTRFNNDIAMLKLDVPMEFTADIMPICLETPQFLEGLLKPGNLGVITGCGGNNAQYYVPTHLHEVKIPIVSPDICRERTAVINTTFTTGMFCAGYSRSMRGDACQGDSGGPFVLEFNGRYVLTGIISWGVGCDRENHYGYYTNVSHYYDWIREKMKIL